VEVTPSPPDPLSLKGRGGAEDDIGRLPSPASGRAGWAVGAAERPVRSAARGGGEGVLLLHGFTGSVESWRSRLPALARHTTVVTVDLIGHGASAAPSDARRYSMGYCVADLVSVLDHLRLPRVAVVGYSMGARVALHLAAAAPDRVAALVVESGSPGLATAEERRARRASDEALAARIDRDGVVAFVDYWQSLPLFALQRRLPAEIQAAVRRQRLRNSPVGLANSLRGMGTGAQDSLWDRLGALSMPALLVVGALDDKFCAIGRAMASSLPRACLALVPDAGHTVHLEQPEEFDRLVREFLEESTTCP
jgi:2-succinyl-6-hydroxy-2,4-cyclohexadiene-1-carboxylate synthase